MRKTMYSKLVFLTIMLMMLFLSTSFVYSRVMPPKENIKFARKIEFTAEERVWINNHKRLKVGVLTNYYPYEYIDKDGQYKGIVSSYLYEIEKDTGIHLELVKFEKPADAIVAFNNGKIDLFSLAIHADVYGKDINISDPYLIFTIGIFTNKDERLLINSLDDLKGKKVAISRDTMIYEPLSDGGLFTIEVVENIVDGIKGVNNGIYDAYIGDVFHTKSIIMRIDLENAYLAAPLNMGTYTFGIGVADGYERFVPIVNKVIAKFSHKNLLEVLRIWTKSNSDSPERIELEYKKYMIYVIIFSLLLLLALYARLIQIRVKSKQINELRKDYKNLFDETPVAMFVHRENKIIYLNKAFAQLVGKEDEYLRSSDCVTNDGSACFDFIKDNFITPIKQHKMRGREDFEDIKIVDANGKDKYINVKSIDINIGRQTQNLIIAVDVTYRKHLEEERSDMLKKIASVQKMETVGLLASKVAHDFNNILSGINGAAEFLNIEIKEDNPLKKYPGIIISACKRAAYLTKQLLFFSKDKTSVLKNIDINECVEESMILLEQSIKNDTNIKLVLKLGASKSNILGNEDLLQNVVMNLVMNSRDAIGKGERGEIIVETKNVLLDDNDIKDTIFDVKKGNFVELRVIDNGPGIPIDVQSKIFEPFFTTKSIDKGNGLGLFAVYGAVREHGATIKFNSDINGTEFNIYFPVVEPAFANSKEQYKSVKKIDAKVLVVDDEEVLLEVSKDILEKLGSRVIVARNYNEAIEKYDSSIDLVVLDVVMPGKGGVDIYKKLIKSNSKIKVIFVSGYNNDKDINKIVSQNENVRLMAKPYNIADFADKMFELFNK